MRVKAALTESRAARSAIQHVRLDELREREVQGKAAATGICHTDPIVRDQWYPVLLPAVLGHDGAGVVERVRGAVSLPATGSGSVWMWRALAA